MRKLIPAIMLFAFMTVNAYAAEKELFIDGVVKVAVPEGWTASVDPKELAVSIVHPQTRVTRMIFSTPNAAPKGDVKQVAEKNYDLMYMFFGDDLEIVDEQENAEIGDKKGYSMEFTAAHGDMEFHGRAFAFAYDDYVVLSIGMALADDYDQFQPEFVEMIESYEIDPEALKKNADHLAELSKVAEQTYNQMMEDMSADDEDDGDEAE